MDKKKIIIAVVVLAALVGAYFLFFSKKQDENTTPGTSPTGNTSGTGVATSPSVVNSTVNPSPSVVGNANTSAINIPIAGGQPYSGQVAYTYNSANGLGQVSTVKYSTLGIQSPLPFGKDGIAGFVYNGLLYRTGQGFDMLHQDWKITHGVS